MKERMNESGIALWRGEGSSFYSPRRSVPARIKYGNTRHRLQEDKDNLSVKDEAERRRHGAG